MRKHATGTFEIKSWDEKTWDGKNWKDVEGAKLTHGIVTQSFHGEIEGECDSHSLTTYRDDGSASLVGLQHLVGRLAGRSGSFVLQFSGDYDSAAAIATVTWSVVAGSGTGDLRGLRGEGGYSARHGESQPHYTLDYDFE